MTRVLMVVSSRDHLAESAQPTGAWLEELAAPYYVFADSGCEVTIASPRGGKAPLDPLSLEAPWLTSNGERFQRDRDAVTKLEHSVPLASIDRGDVDALYCVGGAAAAWDFPDDAHLAALVARLHGTGRPVAGVCHGVLGLTGARKADGQPIVAGCAVTGVSNAEEVMTGFDRIVPVMPENRLRELGGRYSCAAPFAEYVAVDGHLLTGQNPASAAPLAQRLLTRLRESPPA